MILKKTIKLRTPALSALAAILLTALPPGASAQTDTHLSVSGTESASTSISLSKDSKDMDLIVTFSFNEEKNSLTVSLVSYRSLFVFRDNVRYSKIFRGRMMKPKALPYEIKIPEKGRFKAAPSFCKSIREDNGLSSHRNYVFSQGISCKGMQPVPCEYSMLNDRIEQTFDILGQKTIVSVSINDIILIEPYGKKEGRFKFVLDKNVGRTFDILIRRNPCFGKEEEINAAKQTLSAITAAYDSLMTVYGDGTAPTMEAYQLFNGMKTLVTKQFTRINEESKCGCIMVARTEYNQYVDKIAVLDYKMPRTSGSALAQEEINANLMLARARKLDTSVWKWLSSTDPVERRDLEKVCEILIEAANQDIADKIVNTKEQKEACAVMKRAETFYRDKCGK